MPMISILVTSKRSKHNDLRYHLIRDFANTGLIQLEDVRIERNIAYIMTKSLQRVEYSFFTNMFLQDQKE